MSQEKSAAAARAEGSVWLRPWRVLLVALGVVVVGALLQTLDGPVVTPLRLLLTVAGLIAGGWAVKQHLATAGQELDERVESAGLVAVYSLMGLAGYLGTQMWSSASVFFAFFIVATVFGSLLVLLPTLWRRLVGTGLLLFHFGGIALSTVVVQNATGEVPVLPNLIWSTFYRPYLVGLYLTNAYHFYAPDPGSSTLAWFRIEYEDGSARWLKFPHRPSSPTPLHYQRHMGMAESLSPRGPLPPLPEFQKRIAARRIAGLTHPAAQVPMRDDINEYAQYSPPSDQVKVFLPSYVRHVFRHYPHPTDPSIKPKYVKVYKLNYTIVPPSELIKEHDPRDPTDDNLKHPTYLGTFDSTGTLLQPNTDLDDRGEKKADWVPGDNDPFLYWSIPMPYLKYHAGDAKAEEVKP